MTCPRFLTKLWKETLFKDNSSRLRTTMIRQLLWLYINLHIHGIPRLPPWSIDPGNLQCHETERWVTGTSEIHWEFESISQRIPSYGWNHLFFFITWYYMDAFQKGRVSIVRRFGVTIGSTKHVTVDANWWKLMIWFKIFVYSRAPIQLRDSWLKCKVALGEKKKSEETTMKQANKLKDGVGTDPSFAT